MNRYNISFKKNGVCQANLVEAPSAELAEKYFSYYITGAEVYGVKEATADDLRPGKPIITVPDKWIESNNILETYGLNNHDDTFRYQMLDRLRTDCNYYLGNGNRYAKHLWTGDEKEQIKVMKALWESFSDNGKPEWLSYEDILEYQKQMVGVEVLFTFGTSEQFPFEWGYVSITAPSVKMAIEEFRRNYPDVNEGVLNCSDYYYTEESVASIKEHGNGGVGCHRAIVVEARDLTVDELIAGASSRSDSFNESEPGKENVGIEI